MAKLLPLLVLAACVATTLGAQNEYEAAVMADNPTAYFQLRDAPASATQTNEVTTRHLNRVGTFTPQSFTRSDLAFTSSTGQYLQAASHSDFSPPAGVDFSLEIFTYASSSGSGHRSPVTNRQYTGGPGGGPYVGYNLYITPGNEYELWYANGGWQIVSGGSTLFDQWVHLAFSHDASQNKGYFFVNGVQKAIVSYALVQRTSSDPLYVGMGNGGGANYAWVGSLSDLAMFHSFIPGSTWVSRLALDPLVPAIPPTLDPAVAAYCDDIADKCTAMSAECDSIRNGHGPVVGAGTMTNQAGKDNIGEQTGGVTLTGNSVVVTAVGTMYCNGFNCPTSPDGSANNGVSGFLLNGVPTHSLIARFGNTGPWQYVGAGPTTLTGTGSLTFAYNDDGNNYADNNGSWFITIRDDITNVADDCDATVAACNDVHADCVVKVSNCPLV